MNVCRASGRLYGPSHANADASGCIQTLRISSVGNLHVAGGKVLFQPSSTVPNQGFQIDTANLVSGSNAQFVDVPAGWSGNVIKSNLDGIEQFAIRHHGSAWFRGSVGIGVSSATTALDVAGAIKIAGGSEACNANTEGSLRYNAAHKKMEFCNGIVWGGMGGGGSVMVEKWQAQGLPGACGWSTAPWYCSGSVSGNPFQPGCWQNVSKVGTCEANINCPASGTNWQISSACP